MKLLCKLLEKDPEKRMTMEELRGDDYINEGCKNKLD